MLVFLLLLGTLIFKILNTYKDGIRNQMVKEGSNYFCSLCDFSSYKGRVVLNHIDAKHSSSSYTCPACKREGMNSLAALRSHYDRVHLGKVKIKKNRRADAADADADIN